MKIIDILNSGKMSMSFEVFPPKTDTAFENVSRATQEIAKLNPSYMSITYGAGGGQKHTGGDQPVQSVASSGTDQLGRCREIH